MTHEDGIPHPKDFASDSEVRWCPGCGDYAILKAVREVLAELGRQPEQIVFISGIGCAGRFPYYMKTYGFHSIHGRAAAIATGVALANPELDIWVISGDGDSLSIGGNHLQHLLRRNVHLTYLMFNNQIYGLTKGQFSPTSRIGTRSPSSPQGSCDVPVDSLRFALGASGSFIARSIDTFQTHLQHVLHRAHAHPGTGFVEILQNCPIFNDGIHGPAGSKTLRSEHILELHHGQPLVWGQARDKGLLLDPGDLSFRCVTLKGGDDSHGRVTCHDETNASLAWMLAQLDGSRGMPLPVGVLYADTTRPVFARNRKQPNTKRQDPVKIREQIRAALHAGIITNQ